MRRYTVSPPPSLPASLPNFANTEFRKLEQSLADLFDMTPQATNTVPPAPRDGMIRLAQAPWRPVAGQSANAWVYYDAGVWRYL